MKKMSAATPLLIAGTVLPLSLAISQEVADPDAPIEQLTVTGSRIFGQGQTTSPVVQVSNENFYENPSVTISEFLRENVTANNMIDLETDEGNSSGQANTGNRTAGVNLWNLGEENSLTLLNGTRVVQYGAPNGNGWYTTDINTVLPSIALSRADILLDGGSAIYGTDAIAGVVNLVPRYSFEGIEFRAQSDFWPDDVGETTSNAVEGLFGTSFGDGRGSFIVAFDHRQTNIADAASIGLNNTMNNPPFVPGSLTPEEFDNAFGAFDGSAYDWTTVAAGGGMGMGMGMGGGGGTTTLIDPLCGQDFSDRPYYDEGVITPPDTAAPGTCAGYGIPDTRGSESTRYTFFTAAQWEFSDRVTGEIDLGYGYRENLRRVVFNQNTGANSTTGAINGQVPVGHPARVYYEGLDAAWAAQSGVAIDGGESPGPGFDAFDAQESDTINLHAGLDIQLSDRMALNLDFSYGESDVTQNRFDIVVDRYENALNGLGGPACNPNTGTPGIGDCEYFNPFLSSLLPNAESLGLANSPGLVNHIFPDDALQRFFKTDLIDFVAQLDIDTGWELPGGGVSFVVGAEYREENASVSYNEFTRSDGAIGAIATGQVPYSGEQNVRAVFVETVLPLHDRFDIQLATRWDDYNTVGSTVNPKLGLRFDASEKVTLRASYGTSFRAPTPAQTTPTTTRATVPSFPMGPRMGALPVVAVYDAEASLAPQEATHWSVGLDTTLFEGRGGALERLSFSASYVNFEFEDRIALSRALDRTQGLLGNNACGFTTDIDDDGTQEWGGFYQTEDIDRDGVPDAGGAPCWLGADPNGDGIIAFDDLTNDFGFYTNLLASNMEGINLVFSTLWNTPVGSLSANLNATRALTFEFQDTISEPLVDFVGLNGLGFATTPNVREWSANLPILMRWRSNGFWDGHVTSLTARMDTDIEDVDGVIQSGGVTTWDLRHMFNIRDRFSLSLTVRNITGEKRENPAVLLNNGGDRIYLLQFTYSPAGGGGRGGGR